MNKKQEVNALVQECITTALLCAQRALSSAIPAGVAAY